MSDDVYQPRRRTWRAKFGDALRGGRRALRRQSSFTIHVFAAALAIVAAWSLGVSRIEACLLALCIALVLAAEMLNTALEHLAKAVDRRFNPEIAAALDVSSAAVLIAATGAAVVGGLIFGNRFGELMGWW